MTISASLTMIKLTLLVASIFIYLLSQVIKLQKQHKEELKKK